MDGSDYLILSAVAVLFGISVLMSMSEMAFQRMNRVRAVTLEEEGVKGAYRLLRLMEHPERTLNIVLFVNLVCQFVAVTLLALMLEEHLGVVGVVLGLAATIVLFFSLAEVAPKTYAILHTDAAATRLSGVMSLVSNLPPLRVLSRLLIGVANVVLPGKGLKQGPYTYEDEIRTLADVALDEEVIEREEARLIHSVFEFGDTVVREVMVPRTDMVAVEADATVDAALEKAISGGFSRLPVFRDSFDDIVGLVYLKDMVRAVRENGSDTPLSAMVRPGVFVPEQKRVAELLSEMQKDKFHMAVVIDEYGGTAGLVTLEDLLEEIVGEIVDEYDTEEPRVEQLDDGVLLVDGRTSINEVNEVLGAGLPDAEWDTVGGLMFTVLGHVPVVGESVRYQGMEFKAERVQGRRIATIRIEPTESEPAETSP